MARDKTESPHDNQDQIIRKDAKGCFVEVKSDCFHLEKIHLQFVAYDQSRPAGERYTNNVHIYIDVPEFIVLSQEAASGSLYMRLCQMKNEGKSDPLYEHLGGTSARKLAYYGKPRPDGKSVSRVVKLTPSSKSDYFLSAESGAGQENAKGLIVPQFGNKPEQRVSVILSWRHLNELLLTTIAHYNAWLSAKYMAEWQSIHAPRFDGTSNGKKQEKSGLPPATPAQPEYPPAQQFPQTPPPQTGLGSAFGSVYGSGNGSPRADDRRIC